jgi:hypothetical protein
LLRAARRGAVLTVAASVVPWLSCASASDTTRIGSQGDPILADGRPGEIAYLTRLRCPSGRPPHFHMLHRGPHGPSGRGLDRFALRCVIDNESFEIWIDHHHPGVADERAPVGLGIAEP